MYRNNLLIYGDPECERAKVKYVQSGVITLALKVN